jgi:TonB family protein
MKRAATAIVILCLYVTAAAAQGRYCVERKYGPGVGTGEGLRAEKEPEGEQAYSAREVDRKAVITEKPQPAYTEEAKANRVEGRVRLRVVLCPAGKVLDIRVRKGLPDGLTEAALKAARRIKFQPAEKGKRKVAQFVTLEYSFKL